jgi:hypothetical protein
VTARQPLLEVGPGVHHEPAFLAHRTHLLNPGRTDGASETVHAPAIVRRTYRTHEIAGSQRKNVRMRCAQIPQHTQQNSSGIRLKQVTYDTSVVADKGSDIGTHILSTLAFDPYLASTAAARTANRHRSPRRSGSMEVDHFSARNENVERVWRTPSIR